MYLVLRSVIFILVDKTCDMDREAPKFENTVLPMKVIEDGDDRLLEMLLEQPLSIITETNNHGSEEVLFAIEKNRPKCLKILLQKGASPNANDGKHFAIHKAAGSGSEELVETLCQHGVNLAARDINGQTAVHYAIYYQNLPILVNLIYHNANLDITNNSGQTAVHYAVYHGSMLFLRTLIMAKANIDICDQTGRSPLLVAIWKGNLDIIKLLLINQATTDVAAAIDLSPLSTQEIITPVMYCCSNWTSRSVGIAVECWR